MTTHDYPKASDIIVGSRSMGELFSRMRRHEMCNVRGQAYCQQRYGLYERGILLWDPYNSSYEIQIASDPEARIIPGQNEPRDPGNPDPRLDRGELVTVWRNGQYLKRGPWERRIIELLCDVIDRLRDADARDDEKWVEVRARREAEDLAELRALAAAWGGK